MVWPGNEWGTVEGCPARFATAPIAIADSLGVKRGLIASGDCSISRVEDVERIRSLYPEAIACDMESAAIAQVCHLKSVPFAAVRVISDTPGSGDNFAQYVTFWEDAPARTFEVVKSIISTL